MNKTRSTSSLGIDYLEHVPASMEACFLAGEAEWLSRARELYQEDAGEVWADDVLPRLISGKLTETDIEELKEFAPMFLNKIRSERLDRLRDDTVRTALQVLQGRLNS